MGLPVQLHFYNDVIAILDQALECGGGFVECPTRGAAIRWRARAYQARKLIREETVRTYSGMPGFEDRIGKTPYDSLYMRVMETNGRHRVYIGTEDSSEFVFHPLEARK